MKGFKKKGKIILGSVIVFLLLAGSAAYWAADRFLIPHVEGYMVTANDTTDDTDTPIIDTSPTTSGAKHTGGKPSGGATKKPTPTIPRVAPTLSTDTYSNGKVSIKIKKVSKDGLVYYVADVFVSSGKDIMAAFAKNQYGTNITQRISKMAAEHNAIFAINGDYYGFRSDGIVIRNGVVYRDIGIRTGLAIYRDGTMAAYDEKSTSGAALIAQGVWNTLSFGPALLANGQLIPGIEKAQIDTNFGNHSIQGNNPRTGIGIIDQNHFVFVVVDGRREGYSKGISVKGLAQIFQSLGCTVAYNLDGGGSSEMWFNGSVVNWPSNGQGNERSTSDMIYISK